MLQELELLRRDEWMRLVRTTSVGRLILTEHALPAVHIVEFRWWRGDIVIRTSGPTALEAVSRNRIVAFETDELDTDQQCGWSVTVVGHAQVIGDAPDVMELSDIFARSSAGSRRDYFVRIKTEKVTGRQLGRNHNMDNVSSASEFGDDQLDKIGHSGRHRRSQAHTVTRVGDIDGEDHEFTR